MYLAHFGIETSPFLPLSDPEHIFLSSQIRETVQHFFYARENHHALFLLTGEVGAGKTTAIQAIERELPEGTAVAHVHHATTTESQLADELFLGLGLPKRSRETKLARIRRLEAALTELDATSGRPVVILDEAHLVPDAVLEGVRLLTNLRRDGHPVLQVCLAGQPELVERLRAPHLRQLRQRVTLRYEMQPLSPDETELYLIERLRAAGSEAPHRVFDSEAALAVHALTGGIPREINVAADEAMTNAYVDNSGVVRREHVEAARRDFGYEGLLPPAETPAPPDRDGALKTALRARDARGQEEPEPPATTGLVARARAKLSAVAALARRRPTAVRFTVASTFASLALVFGTSFMPSDAPSRTTPAGAPSNVAMADRDEIDEAAIEIDSPVPAVVWLGDRRLGTAPGRFAPVPPGRHELKLEASDGRVLSKSVLVTPGETSYVRVRTW